MSKNREIVFNVDLSNNNFDISSDLESAIVKAKEELEIIEETINSITELTPKCDKIDYALAVSSGIICGLFDIFLVGKPGESPVGNITDKWFESRTVDFAKLCGWKSDDNSPKSAIKFLEEKFKIPYDQTGLSSSSRSVFDLSPNNHHFKSLSHNPTLLGLFFSVLDQFQGTSHFVTGGELIILENVGNGFELKGRNVTAKLFSATVNWFGHLISDVSGSSSSKTRGMGIPAPLLAWTNNIIAIKKTSGIPVYEFEDKLNETAKNIYLQGYDVRFQTAQMIPVFINEMIVRFMYSARRLVKYFSVAAKENFSFSLMWKTCEPFSNPTVKRMLTVAHGTFCLIDLGDALIRGALTGGGTFNGVEFFMRLNIPGIGRFCISLYGEIKRSYEINRESKFAAREKFIVEDYINSLMILSDIYNDKELLMFTEDLKNSNLYIQAFNKTVRLAEMRNVADKDILRTKSDIDNYFVRRN